MAADFSSSLNLGSSGGSSAATFSFNNAQGSSTFGSVKQPTVVLAHLGFRAGAILCYIFANLLSSSFIVQFLLILGFSSADFWAVKNVTGRLLVGLRWWNIVDENGNNHWRYEAAKEDRSDPLERRIFWLGLILAPVFWTFFGVISLLTFHWQWAMVTFVLGLSMTSTNLYGYLRCRWHSTGQLTNAVSRWALFNMIRSAQQAGEQPQQQQQQQIV